MSKVSDIFNNLRRRFEDKSSSDRTGQELKSSSVVQISNHDWLFGLDWQSYIEEKELPPLLQSAKKQGYSHYIVNQLNDVVGFAAEGAKKIRNKSKSAAIQLAETSSFGGLELFTFKLPDGFYAFIALNESRPVPHFDAVGTETEIMELVTEYRALHTDQSIRYVGNTEWFDNLEKLSVTEAFSDPENAARMLALPNYKLRKLILTIFLPLVAMVVAVAGWYINEQQKEEQERLRQEQDPNFIYENSVGNALQQVEKQAQIDLDRWREVIYRIPTERAGWRLEKIICIPAKCDVTWRRDFGSYHDFHSSPIEGLNSSNDEQIGDSPSKAKISEVIVISKQMDAAQGIKRADLLPLRKVLEHIASKLQDISLLPNIETKLKPPELYPKTGAAIEQISNPVVKGEWSIRHDIWSLKDLSFEFSALVLQNLIVQQEEKSNAWSYTLGGAYYAKVKDN